ncbi:HNH endonuclease [Chloroflexi bacterium TSY]|nr:HNH endonuclease [Chloroflexi bacterium TSY]
MAKPRKYTDSQLVEAVKTSYSIRAVLLKIGLAPAGGNYESVAKRIENLNLDTSHFLGQAILRGKTHRYGTRPLAEILVRGKLENTWRLKNRLLRENVKAHQCERCGNSTWLNAPIPLELHHKDGDRTNNLLRNIELLCPNCHALTDNYRGGKKKV